MKRQNFLNKCPSSCNIGNFIVDSLQICVSINALEKRKKNDELFSFIHFQITFGYEANIFKAVRKRKKKEEEHDR